jgi:hypothetical protein
MCKALAFTPPPIVSIGVSKRSDKNKHKCSGSGNGIIWLLSLFIDGLNIGNLGNIINSDAKIYYKKNARSF